MNLFKALENPARRRIIEVLRNGERKVGNIVKQTGICQPSVSRHLRILHQTGIVSVRPDRQLRLYSLRPELFRELDACLANYRRLRARLGRFEAALGTQRQGRGAQRG
jgi:DNA-binding transcriptional ArsR family regulator